MPKLTHSAAPPLPIEPASLGFDRGLRRTGDERTCGTMWASSPTAENETIRTQPKAPSGRGRRVKKMCQWHIFSQRREQSMIATRAEGCRAKARLRERPIIGNVFSLPPSFAFGKIRLPPRGRLLRCVFADTNIKFTTPSCTGGYGIRPYGKTVPNNTSLIGSAPQDDGGGSVI